MPESDIEMLKRSVRMVHGQAMVDEMPENFWRVCADILVDSPDKMFRGGVVACVLNLVGAQVDQTLKIEDYT